MYNTGMLIYKEPVDGKDTRKVFTGVDVSRSRDETKKIIIHLDEEFQESVQIGEWRFLGGFQEKPVEETYSAMLYSESTVTDNIMIGQAFGL